MSTDYKFEGWMGLDKSAAQGNMEWKTYDPKPFDEETDIDIKIDACGVCGSDIHTLRSGWGATDYPCVVGHEVVGSVQRIGKFVKTELKKGDRVAGVGAQSGSCLRKECNECQSGNEQHCQNGVVNTYNDHWPDGSKSYGGYAKYWRGHSHFVIPIPDSIPPEEAAPMLCGGVTTYSPLKQHGAKGKRVGIIGIGGLGHFGVLFAKALGAKKITAISRKSDKKDDALKMGADQYIATDEDKGWAKKNAKSLDLIICTVSSSQLPLMDYLTLLDLNGVFVQVGAPEDPIPQFNAFALILKNIQLRGSMIGSPGEIKEMLQLVADQKIKPWIQTRPMKEANDVVQDLEKGLARYRYVLVNSE